MTAATAHAVARSAGWPRVQAGSQSARILDVLKDGRWVSSLDLHRQVLCVLHSRVAALRARGYVIEHRGEGFGAEFHEYRLVNVPLETGAVRSVVAPAAGTPVSSGPSAAGLLTTSGAVGHVAGSSAAVSLVGELERAPEILDGQLSVFDALAAVA